MTRKQAREETFILIFEKLFTDSSLDEIVQTAVEVRDICPDEYLEKVFFGVYENVNDIDEIISSNSKGWKIERISKTALAILRLAVFEMNHCDDIPVSVSINEAVELAKKYATKEDASYINGILATVSRANENA